MQKVFYITTPIYYVNADPHIGHVYSTMIADCLARYHKLVGKEVFFVTGTDEHGQKVEQKAKSNNKTPKEYADEISQHFKDCFGKLDFEYDRFIRTTDEDHIQEVTNLWKILRDNDDIYLGNYEGWYSISDETFVPDGSVIDGKDPITQEECKIFNETGSRVVRAKEENYMFRLSKYQSQILEWLLIDNPVIPAYRNQDMINFVQDGLHDISVSRKRTITEWGIDIPDDPSSDILKSDDFSPACEKGDPSQHVIYVWLDALANYKTAANVVGKNIFPADIHVVGKDILKFHAVYWIGFLLSAGLPLPGKILAHGWWLAKKAKLDNLENQAETVAVKMSKSIGNVVDPSVVSAKYGNDVLRYVLLRESSFERDSEYSEEILISRLNSDLANTLGNLVMRCLSKKLNPTGLVPKPPSTQDLSENETDSRLIENLNKTIKKCDELMQIPDIQNYIITFWNFLFEFNSYITDEKPWALIKNNQERFSVVSYNMLEILRIVALMISPILVNTSKKILDFLNIQERKGAHLLKYGLLKENHIINTDAPVLFEKVELDKK
jgi:methionyl-tRNA synthetase